MRIAHVFGSRVSQRGKDKRPDSCQDVSNVVKYGHETNLDKEINEPFEYIFAVRVAIITGVQVHHKARM